MKYLFFFLTIAMFAVQAQAEVKPQGSLVPVMCGNNYLEMPNSGPDYPSSVCMMTVTDADTSATYAQYAGKKIIQVNSGIGTRYILITGEFEDCGSLGTEVWQGYEMKSTVDGSYSFPDGVNLASPRVELYATQTGSSNLILRGTFFQVTMEPVFVTQ